MIKVRVAAGRRGRVAEVRPRGRRHSSWRMLRTAGLMLAPSLVMILAFSYYPAIRALYFSFFSWDGFNDPVFVGLRNFQTYLSNPNFGLEVRNIAILSCGSIIIAVTMPLLGAELIFNLRSRRAAAVYKPLLVIPMVIPFIVNVEIWAYIFAPQLGLLDNLLGALHLSAWQRLWLADPSIAIYCIVAIGFPWVSGLSFLIYLAGLQTIPQEILDAFRLDGHSIWQRLRYLDLPLIAGQFRLVIVLTLIAALQNFVLVLVLTNGGPGVATMVPGLEMYMSAFSYDEFGLGMAIGTMIFLAILALTLLLLRVGRDSTGAGAARTQPLTGKGG